MDENLKKVFERTKQEFEHINRRWAIYVQLFGTNSHRIDLINQTESILLVEFQWLVIDSMILSLSKLTDPAKMGGNSNLSFSHIICILEKRCKRELLVDLKEILKQLQKASSNFRKIRNKRIAHSDLAVALGSPESPLPGVSRADVKRALEIAQDFLNKIESAFFDSTTRYDMFILPLKNSGRSTLIRLQKSLAYDKLVDEGVIDRNKWRELGNIDDKSG